MKHFYLRAEKLLRDDKSFMLPNGEWYSDPHCGKYDVIIRGNNLDEFALTGPMTEYRANKWIAWINRRFTNAS